MRVSFFHAVAAALLIGGCSTPKIGGSEDVTVVQGADLPPPTRLDQSSTDRAYLIGPFDKLMIDVYGVEELSKKEVQADASGRISFPLAGEIEAAGKTPAELASLIEGRLRGNYVREPQVTVNLVETVSQVVTVDGEVKEPGLYPVIGKMTLMRAIARARGTTEYAQQSHVVVFRTVENKEMAALYDLRAIRRGYYSDPEVYANDVVVVGESQARRIFSSVLQGSGLLTAPIIALVQR
jgi:polysaccharide export outer membrane protein